MPAKAKTALDRQANMKGPDFGKAIGIDRPANVRDKIRKWQTDLAADDSGAENAIASGNESDAKAAASPKLQPTPKAGPLEEKTLAVTTTPALKAPSPANDSIEITPQQPKSANKPVHNKLDEDVHIATAPKKRVVSDSHWRNKKSPPKDPTTRPSPKPLPNAWVRPSARKLETTENKATTPTKPEPKQRITFTPKNTTPRTRSARKRRPSRPTSSGNDNRPTSSGSASAKDEKAGDDASADLDSPSVLPEKDKYELIRVRRRPKSESSPRSSVSAEESTNAPRRKSIALSGPLKHDDSTEHLITVEYEASQISAPVEEPQKERRRRSRRKENEDNTPEESPKEPVSSRRRTHRKSHQQDVEDDRPARTAEPPVTETPPKVFGSRLEAWLSTTPDPFVDKESRNRRRSKESVSTLEPGQRTDKSDVTASTETLDAPIEEEPERKSSGKRRRRKRSTSIKVDTQDLDDTPSTVVPSEHTDTPEAANDRDATPSPTLGLKRRGARRSQYSPTKDRAVTLPVRQLTAKDDDDASSAPSSSVDPTSMELEKISLRPRPDTFAMRRMFPSTGKRLSTIVSVETFHEKTQAPSSIAEESDVTGGAEEPEKRLDDITASEISDQFNTETLTVVSRRSTRRRRLASHSDLISVLSMPKAGTRSIVSARSIRTNRSRLATATMPDIMSELASDEVKYMRELRTLVDGVIPVLLSCVLSKSDSAVAAGLFSRSSNVDPSNVTKPIVDMGVCLERLKTLHRRVPKDNSDAFLSWAQSAQRVYSDYIDSWRLGFEDVVISLAPADEDPFVPAKVVQGPDDAAPWDEGLPRNAEGYVVNGDGERVDVAYMLKRPLVRLKYLAKTMKGINHVKPAELAETMSNAFQDLVTAARKRSNDERARLEDVAAANIDPTRARDPRSLAPLAGVRIDPARCVRARDFFDMHLLHSSGQEVNCRVELLLRDNAPGNGAGGDLLLCEADATGRWLFFPPIQHGRISARNGDLKGEIVVMIRGFQGDGAEWSEVFSLRSDEEQAGFEWVQMLGLQPIPPQLSELKRELSIIKTPPRPTSSLASSLVSAATGSTLPQKSRTPSPHEIEIPIGEQANSTSKKWGYETPDRRHKSRSVSPITPPSSDVSRPNGKSGIGHVSPVSPVGEHQYAGEKPDVTPTRPTSQGLESQDERTPRSLNEAMQMAGSSSPNLRRTKATKRLSKNPPSSQGSPLRPSRQIVLDDPEEETKKPRRLSKRRQSQKPPESTVSQSSKGFSVWMPGSEVEYSDGSEEEDSPVEDMPEPPTRPQTHRRVSSAPSMDLPTIPKIRKTSQPTTPAKASPDIDVDVPEPPASAPSKLIKRRSEPIPESLDLDDEEKPPPVPPHRSPSPASPSSPVTIKGSNTPTFLPAFKTKRRSSSPLKHEYEPSTATESSSESEEEVSEDDDSITSESTDDELEDDVPMPLMPVGQPKQYPKVSPPSSVYTTTKSTITPSQSASQSPYRTVPQTSAQTGNSIASIFSWSDSGKWDSLHPDECSIVVTPGKIEIFEITVSHSKPLLADGEEIFHPEGKAPLLAVELTPLVPMRKSTAIDITIRSPPTAHSRINSGNNIMLRSRNPTECAQLYAMINQSRINNPTYIALQNARGPYGQSSWAEAMDRQNAARTNGSSSGGWFSGSLGRRSSYRKTSTRAASISAVTESSVGTMNTALRSALGRFSFGKNGRFNIRSSTLGSRSSNRSFDTPDGDADSMGSGGSGASTPINGGEPTTRAPNAPQGITNTKVRLYERDSLSSKWRDMGAARLTIMLPDLSDPSLLSHPSPTRQGKGSPGTRDPSQEKRIVIVGKSKGEVLLDATLGESCFERVARSGIAVSVWEDVVGEDGRVGVVGKSGGVGSARARVFMVQMKSERECAYSFSLLGKLRY